MIVADIFDMAIVEVRARGVPNEECIILSFRNTVNLGQYGIILGVKGNNASAFPLRDNFFWFGDGFVNAGDWMFVYTGPGQARSSDLPNSRNKIYSAHWGRKATLFSNKEIVPILIRVDAVQVAVLRDEFRLPTQKRQS